MKPKVLVVNVGSASTGTYLSSVSAVVGKPPTRKAADRNLAGALGEAQFRRGQTEIPVL